MIARMLPSPVAGRSVFCGGFAICDRGGLPRAGQEARSQEYSASMATIDASQPGELRKISQLRTSSSRRTSSRSWYAAVSDWSPATVRRSGVDGFVDLGFGGNVYVYGLTLAEAEERIAVQLNDLAADDGDETQAGLTRCRFGWRMDRASTTTCSGRSPTQGRFKVTGDDTVLDAILLGRPATNSLPEKAYLVRPHPLGRRGPGL